ESAGLGASGDKDLIIESLTAQLHDLYAEKERSGGLASSDAAMESLVEQLHALYAEKESAGPGASGDKDLIIESLTAQLHDLYAEKERSGGSDEADASLVAQLHDLYAEKERLGGHELQAIVDSLDSQLTVFVEEKLELEDIVSELTQQLEDVRGRARRISGALLDSALNA
ncbi:MAG: hypothetical protein AAFZ18_31355, partial [Myxococcota bacterium]